MNYTTDQLALQAFINAENEKFIEQAKSRGATGWAVHVSDTAHWAEYDIFTIEQYQHFDAQSTHYDLFKEINGIRPRWYDYSKMTTEAIWAEVESLNQQYAEEQKSEAEIEAAIHAEYEANKKANSYQPNLAFGNLKSLLAA
jgi:hypothetical protein